MQVKPTGEKYFSWLRVQGIYKIYRIIFSERYLNYDSFTKNMTLFKEQTIEATVKAVGLIGILLAVIGIILILIQILTG